MSEPFRLEDLSPADLLLIEKKRWRLLWHDEKTLHVLEDRGFVQTEFEALEVAAGLTTGAVTVKRAPPLLPTSTPADEDAAFGDLDARGQREVLEIWAKCSAMKELRAEKQLVLTDQGFEANRDSVEQRARQILRGDATPRARDQDPSALVMGCARSELQYFRDWRSSEGSLRPFVDNRRLGSQNRPSRQDEPTLWKYFIIARKLYLGARNVTANNSAARAMRSYEADQKARAKRGGAPLPSLSSRTLTRYLTKVDPMEVNAARHGADFAVALLRSSTAQDRPHQIGQRVEIDGHEVDVHTAADKMGLLSEMAPEYRNAAKTIRIRMIKAIDCATDTVLGLSFGLNETSANAKRCVDMVTRDKWAWSQAAGCKHPWRHACVPTTMVSDTGSAFISDVTIAALLDTNIAPFWPMPQHPHTHGRIERHNRTEDTNLFRHLYGQVVPSQGWPKKPNGQELASLVISDFMRVMIRWVCDVYHQTPKASLDGMTPDQAWDFHLARTSMVAPLPDSQRRRALGDRVRRLVEADGITVLGIAYHSEQLFHLGLKTRGQEVEVATDPNDLGCVSAKVAGQWIDVEALDPRFHGVTRDEWCLARQRLRSASAANNTVSADTALSTIDDIRTISSNSAKFSGLRDADLGGFELERLKEEATTGIRVRANFLDGPLQSQALPGTPLGDDRASDTASVPTSGWWHRHDDGDPS